MPIHGSGAVKFILPALTEATSPYWRPIKYSLFPPLGLATLAGHLHPDVEVTLQDEHVERLEVDDHPDLVAIQVYITNARRVSTRSPTTIAPVALLPSCWAACTSPRCRTKRRSTLTRSSWGRATAHFPDSRATWQLAGRCRATHRRRARWNTCRRLQRPHQAAPLPRPQLDRSSPAAARTTVRSVTRTPSSPAAARSIPSGLTMR